MGASCDPVSRAVERRPSCRRSRSFYVGTCEQHGAKYGNRRAGRLRGARVAVVQAAEVCPGECIFIEVDVPAAAPVVDDEAAA